MIKITRMEVGVPMTIAILKRFLEDIPDEFEVTLMGELLCKQLSLDKDNERMDIS